MTALNLFNDSERIFNFDAYKNIRFKNQKKDAIIEKKLFPFELE